MKLETKDSPALSVIVPVYNAENTLRQCVDSILRQEYKDFEVILIDDGSKDASPQICDEYATKDNRVKVFHKENGGVSSARNLGLDHAQGEWITFVDSDDYISRGYFDRVDEHDEDILFCDYHSILNGKLWEIGSEHFKFDGLSLNLFLNENLTSNYIRSPYMKFYKRSLIKRIRFHNDMRIAEDLCFVLDYLCVCKTMGILPNVYYVICTHAEPQEIRYSVTVDYAAQSLHYLKTSFENLRKCHVISRNRFLPIVGFFKAASMREWKNSPHKWWSHSLIKMVYQYMWPDLTIKQKIKLISAKLLKW